MKKILAIDLGEFTSVAYVHSSEESAPVAVPCPKGEHV